MPRQSKSAMPRRARAHAAVVFVAALGVADARAAVEERAPSVSTAATNLADLSLEQLGNIVVLSVSRREESLAEAPASIYVITGEDIRRSGATSLPEALRLAPNLLVARADTNQYAVSARGFNNVLANKLLVMIDGRTVYTPLFSGVFWEAQDVLVSDVARIEVISGPGATLWGANAVNGVINVITRPAAETQGTTVSLGGGNLEYGASGRFGGALPGGGHYRVYGKAYHRDHSEFGDGTPIRDRSDRGQVGFRADWAADRDTLTVQGDAYLGDIDQAPSARTVDGANLLARWTRTFAGGSSARVQAYWDRTHREHPQSFEEHLDTFDVEGQYGVRAGIHELLFGGGFRYARDRVVNSAQQAFMPADRTLRWANAFVQDQIELHPDVDLTLGAKIEHNDYTGAEFLPSARVGWRPSGTQMLWTAISRAVRAPSRIDRELNVPGVAPFFLAGNDSFASEIANVYEVGWRAQPLPTLSYTLTVFHHDYTRMRSLRPQVGGAVFANGIEGTTTGLEGWGVWRVLPSWRLSAGVTALRERLKVEPGLADSGVAGLGNDPAVQWQARSTFDLGERHEIDIALRHVAALPEPTVPAYTAVDARWAWHPTRELEVSLTGQNLFDPRHPEWGAAPNRAEIQRSLFLRIRWTM